MPTYQRETRVDASLEDVWEFHSRISGLEALTPDWMHLQVEDVRGPNGRTRSDGVLLVGSEVRLSVRPFGVGPRRPWVSRITRREREDGAAVFEDEMVEGPFPEWHHSHQFYADGGGTLIRDRVRYELPVLGGLLGPLGWLGFEPMFRGRHRRTKRVLEDRRDGADRSGADD
ncbi:cyclase [Halobacteriales archaeon QS_1_67_19]|nr:MAG: cyclase [Halobacteriales archaeon QS_1_67_19]